MSKQKVLCVVAGKSGGHIIPGITHAQNFIEHNPEYKVLLFSTDTSLDRTITNFYTFISFYVPLTLTNFPRSRLLGYPLFVGQFIKAFFKSLKELRHLRPEKIVSMGGYVSFPVCIAGWLLRIPITVYELNAIPGRAVQWLAPLSTKVLVCFDQACSFFASKKVEITPYPIRFKKKELVGKAQACSILGLDPERKTLLLLGGSQGSRFLNMVCSKFITNSQYLHSSIQVIHQTGSSDIKSVKKAYENSPFPVIVFDYRHDIQLCYEAADVVIARAGAGTLFELVFFSKSALIVPLESATTSHQIDNAHAIKLQRPDLFYVLSQKAIEQDPQEFYAFLVSYLSGQQKESSSRS